MPPLRVVPPGRVTAPRPGLHGGFISSRFGPHHLIGLGNRRFFFDSCFSIFDPFFCNDFFLFHRFAAFSPFVSLPIFYSYPAFYSQSQAYATSRGEQNELVQQVVELAQEVQQLREEEIEPERKPAEPLVIERQGDRFVRVNQIDLSTVKSQPERSHAAEQLPTTILVFRDGRRVELNGYTIVDRVLYASVDYAANGYWTKKISLADLDLSATIKLNEQRGTRFTLPRAPNEVITRP
jgi:hypothetical protein